MSNTVFCLIDGGTYIHTTEYYKDLEEKKTVFLNKKQKWSGMKKKMEWNEKCYGIQCKICLIFR